MQVRETQRLDWRDGGAELVVHSEPRIEVPGGARFTTSARFHVRPRAANGGVAGCTARPPVAHTSLPYHTPRRMGGTM